MSYSDWVEKHYPYLFDIYTDIIKPNQVSSKLSFQEFCEASYVIHQRQ